MPQYLANRWFNSTSEMSSFLVDATDEDGLGPFLVRVDDTGFKLVVWRKSSTATIDNETVFSANGPGRWVALANSLTNSEDMHQFIDVTAMMAYTETPSETMLYCLNTTPPALYAWDGGSTATEDGDNIVKLTALATGRMYKIYPISVGISSDPPTTIQPFGATYIWTENDAINSYDSIITYYSNGTEWIEIDTRMLLYEGTPDDLSKTPNSERETWKDTTTGIVYHAFSGGWVAGGGAS